MNLSKIYKDFLKLKGHVVGTAAKPPLSISSFRKIFFSYNLSFRKSRKDSCAKCDSLKIVINHSTKTDEVTETRTIQERIDKKFKSTTMRTTSISTSYYQFKTKTALIGNCPQRGDTHSSDTATLRKSVRDRTCVYANIIVIISSSIISIINIIIIIIWC